MHELLQQQQQQIGKQEVDAKVLTKKKSGILSNVEELDTKTTEAQKKFNDKYSIKSDE